MPPGVPTATVGIGRGENAAILAAEILALKRTELVAALDVYRKEMAARVEEADASLQG
jgi:5-(carboxyamino)imidazole ribonucleotide mutase